MEAVINDAEVIKYLKQAIKKSRDDALAQIQQLQKEKAYSEKELQKAQGTRIF
jgi:ribosome recycling factor